MSFCIFNSSKAKLALVVVVFVGLCVAFDGALELYSARKTSKTQWIENKVSKVKHLNQQRKTWYDYIFVGSSRTIFHVDSSVFQSNGLHVYNAGVSAVKVQDLPYMVHHALAQEPKAIVISLSVDMLYQEDDFSDFGAVTLTDLRFIYRTQPFVVRYRATMAFLRQMHRVLMYREAIYTRLRQLFDHFVIEDRRGVSLSGGRAVVTTPFGNKSDVSYDIGCKIFDRNKVSVYKTIVKCTNGDAALIGHYIPDDYQSDKRILEDVHQDRLALLNASLDEIQDAGVKVILVLEPVFRSRFSYDVGVVAQLVHADAVYDLTSYEIADEYWADINHLNYEGRRIYSQKLYTTLRTGGGYRP